MAKQRRRLVRKAANKDWSKTKLSRKLTKKGLNETKATTKANPNSNAGGKLRGKERAAQVQARNKERQAKRGAQREAVGNIGKKFTRQNFKALKEAGTGANRLLKIAASSKRVGDKASSKLSSLNPGIKLPKLPVVAANERTNISGGTPRAGRAQDRLRRRNALKKVGKQLKGAGKNYLQWGGTDAKGRPQALGGFQIGKKMRSGNALKIGMRSYKKGSFTQQDGSGSYLGRGAIDILGKKGKQANKVTAWAPGNRLGKKGGGGGGGGEGLSGLGGEGFGDYGMDSGASESPVGSGVFGGSGANVAGSPNFRRRRSSRSALGISAQGASRLGSNLTRPSGLSIPV
jgi:hypothetical protein